MSFISSLVHLSIIPNTYVSLGQSPDWKIMRLRPICPYELALEALGGYSIEDSKARLSWGRSGYLYYSCYICLPDPCVSVYRSFLGRPKPPLRLCPQHHSRLKALILDLPGAATHRVTPLQPLKDPFHPARQSVLFAACQRTNEITAWGVRNTLSRFHAFVRRSSSNQRMHFDRRQRALVGCWENCTHPILSC
jgi:hypothetical protein